MVRTAIRPETREYETDSFVPVHRLHRECGQADGDVFGAAFLRCGVAHPLAGVGDDRLSGVDVEQSSVPSVLDPQHSFQHDREFVELGSLAGLEPSLRAAHVGDAGGGSFRVDAADVFVDEFGLVAGGLNSRGLWDECGHEWACGSRFGFRFKSTTKAFTAEFAEVAEGMQARKNVEDRRAGPGFPLRNGTEYGVPGGVPGMMIGGPGTPSGPGAPGMTVGAVPGDPGMTGGGPVSGG